MMKSKLTIITLLSIVTILISCNSTTKSNLNENKSSIDKLQVDKNIIDSKIKNEPATKIRNQTNSKESEFLSNLKTGEKLSSLFNDNWIFIYHEYNRCDGSTDGQIDNLKSTQIDTIIILQVKNDGDGWACDKKEPKTFNLDFDLQKKIKDWDRFEIPNYENQEENIVYVVGAGESDYIKIYYDDNDLIIKLEYRSEDPG